jgi:hypothetical protein
VQSESIGPALAAPFPDGEVKFKPQTVKGNQCLAVAYVTARAVMDRLDAVMGVGGWQDSYEPLAAGCVLCRLSLKFADEWVTREDVGGQSEQPDEADRLKAAYSDALKRAAVKFGIGRYLHRRQPQWVEYDPQRRQIVGKPRLPQGPAVQAAPVAAVAISANGQFGNSQTAARPATPAQARKPQPVPGGPVTPDPLAERVLGFARKLAALPGDLCSEAEVVNFVCEHFAARHLDEIADNTSTQLVAQSLCNQFRQMAESGTLPCTQGQLDAIDTSLLTTGVSLEELFEAMKWSPDTEMLKLPRPQATKALQYLQTKPLVKSRLLPVKS